MKLIKDNRDPKKLDLTVATKNEENRIRDFVKHHKSFNIVILDDNSTDKTLLIADKLGCTLFQRERSTEPKSVAPTEYAHYEYINNHSISGKAIKLDVDEFIDERFLDLFTKNILDANINIIKRRVDKIWGKEFELFKSEQPLVLKKNQFKCDPESLHNGLYLSEKSINNLKLYVKVVHTGHINGILKIQKIIYYVGQERLENNLKNKNYFLFICKRYIKPYILFPVKRINWLIKSPKLYFTTLIVNFIEIFTSFYLFIENDL
tara:strand:- start:3850 stop:4638 length:789 start_codon:yes stop_codon:yes gene_type:complete